MKLPVLGLGEPHWEWWAPGLQKKVLAVVEALVDVVVFLMVGVLP